MDIFDLLFIALFLSGLVALGAAGVAALQGKRSRANRILCGTAISAAIYMGIVCVDSYATPQRILNIGDPQCSDDWCIAVREVQRNPLSKGLSYSVTLLLSSRARRVAQRENGVIVYLVDSEGRRFDPVPKTFETPFNVLLQPGESLTAIRVFDLPVNARDLGLVVDHAKGPLGCFPSCFVITENNWFHKLPIVRLD
jgi:hypothetical protein